MNSTETTDLLQAGIAAAKAGHAQQARDLLLRVLEQDEQNVTAWLWLSGIIEDVEEKQICLENVLAVDPDNKLAQKGLRLLQQQQPTPPAAEPPPPPKRATPSPQKKPRSKYKRLPSKKDSPDQANTKTNGHDQPPSYTKPEKPKQAATPNDNPLDNEYGCPYCVAPTKPDDKKCGQCGGKLWLRIPKLSKPSFYFKVLFFFQVLNTLSSLFPLGSLLLVPFVGLSEGLSLPDDAPAIPEMSVLLLAVMIPLLLIPALYNIFILVGLIKRWRFIFYLYLIQAVFGLGAVGAFIVLIGLDSIMALVTCGGPLALVSITQLFLAFNLGEDFTFNEKRLSLTVDPGELGVDLMKKGEKYARQNMWGLAALYFRQAARRLHKDLGPLLSLAVAYNNLKLYDWMADTAKRAQKIKPDDPRVRQLAILAGQKQNQQ